MALPPSQPAEGEHHTPDADTSTTAPAVPPDTAPYFVDHPADTGREICRQCLRAEQTPLVASILQDLEDDAPFQKEEALLGDSLGITIVVQPPVSERTRNLCGRGERSTSLQATNSLERRQYPLSEWSLLCIFQSRVPTGGSRRCRGESTSDEKCTSLPALTSLKAPETCSRNGAGQGVEWVNAITRGRSSRRSDSGLRRWTLPA